MEFPLTASTQSCSCPYSKLTLAPAQLNHHQLTHTQHLQPSHQRAGLFARQRGCMLHNCNFAHMCNRKVAGNTGYSHKTTDPQNMQRISWHLQYVHYHNKRYVYFVFRQSWIPQLTHYHGSLACLSTKSTHYQLNSLSIESVGKRRLPVEVIKVLIENVFYFILPVRLTWFQDLTRSGSIIIFLKCYYNCSLVYNCR